jgi:hypothetical protein
LYWGTFIVKKAGLISYDGGLCSHTYIEAIDFPPETDSTANKTK